MNTALGQVDLAVRVLWDSLQERQIADCVNVMIVSDHGMTSINVNNLVNIANVSEFTLPVAKRRLVHWIITRTRIKCVTKSKLLWYPFQKVLCLRLVELKH